MNYLWILFFSTFTIFLIIKLKDLYHYYYGAKTHPLKNPKVILETKVLKQGMQVDKLKEGSGPGAVSGKTVTVHYRAFLQNGTEVDSSYLKGKPFEFTMGKKQVIPGWEMGMQGMKVGEVSRFLIAPEHAYGATGKGTVPPNAEMIFEVTLLKMK
jgi:FKBP-type peptidyl-prolyl cis-trans isomerase